MRSSAFACAAAAWIGLAGAIAAYAQETAAPPSAQAPQQAPAQSSTPPATNQNPQPPAAAGPISYSITGIVHTGKSALPGVTVTASNTLTGKKLTTTTALDGTFSFSLSDRGRYVVRAEFLAFAPQTQEVLLNPQNQKANVDLDLSLASRVRELQQEQQAARAAAGNVGARHGFQTLAATPDLSDLNAQNANPSADLTGNGFGANAADLNALPFAGAGTDTATESVVSTGALGQSQNFGGGSEAQIQQRIDEFRQSFGGGAPGGFGGSQFGGGGFGGPGGGGIIGRAVGARGFNINQPHGALYFSDDNAGPDAAPFSLNGAPVQKASYNQAHFGALVGGPLNIPKIYHGGTKTFFFVNYNGTRASNPYDAFSTVPTLLERQGNFNGAVLPNGQPVQIFNPATDLPFPGNMVPISPAAQTLLNYIPVPSPNISSSSLNFHYVTAGQSDTDSINVRLIHNFGAGFLPQSGGRGGGGGGRRRQGQNINFVLNYSRTNSQILSPFPSTNGTNGTQGLNAGVGYSYNKGKLFSLLRFNYNHLHTSTSNLYAYINNIEQDAGILGVSTNAFDWGLPILNFSDLQGVSDPSAKRALNQTYTLSETLGWSRNKHTFRFGGDYRRILQSLRSDQNARGSFTFTGLATAQLAPCSTLPMSTLPCGPNPAGTPVAVPGTGFDFADFLLGLPQLTSVQGAASQTGTLTFGNTAFNFRSNSYDLFAQDEWKIFSNFTVNMGVRYEYQGPLTEANNHIVNLDVLLDLPGSLQAAPVLPGAVGPFTGITYPNSLIEPARNNFAPRVGLAWKPLKRLVVRAGYGWNYNLAQYSA
ncbi:MAG TPA: TonB-dependent receptor, partial [Candidatus Acidoferrales bacterium]|nr:TonB-dependent receptor [Candidatus Acidoferrales bacterium]